MDYERQREMSVLVCALFIHRIDFQKTIPVYKGRDILLSEILTFSLSVSFFVIANIYIYAKSQEIPDIIKCLCC